MIGRLYNLWVVIQIVQFTLQKNCEYHVCTIKKNLTQFLCSSSQDFFFCFVQNHLLSIINCILKDSITFFVQFFSNNSFDLTFLSTKVKPFFTAWVECNSTFHNVLWDDITIRTVLSICFGIWDLGKLFHYILSTYIKQKRSI